MADTPKITKDGNDDMGSDYTANIEPGESVWLRVGKFSLYVKRETEGVVVDAYVSGEEYEPIATMCACESDIVSGDEA